MKIPRKRESVKGKDDLRSSVKAFYNKRKQGRTNLLPLDETAGEIEKDGKNMPKAIDAEFVTDKKKAKKNIAMEKTNTKTVDLSTDIPYGNKKTKYALKAYLRKKRAGFLY